MRKIAFITAVLAALAAAVPASGALLAKSCGNSCATLTASGKGSLGVVGSGAEWGSFSSGTVWVRDRTGKGNPRNWVHGSSLRWKWLGDDGWKATTTRSLTFSASGKFWVKLQGTNIQMSGVVDGTGNIKRTGTSTYTLNGRKHTSTYTLNGNKHSWPSANRALTF